MTTIKSQHQNNERVLHRTFSKSKASQWGKYRRYNFQKLNQ